MLPAVERNHLASQGWGSQNEANRCRDFLGSWSAAKQCARRFYCKVGIGLMYALEHWPWADGIDADAWRHGLG